MRHRPIRPLPRIDHDGHIKMHGGQGCTLHHVTRARDQGIGGALIHLEQQLVMHLQQHAGG